MLHILYILGQYWPSVADGQPTFIRHWFLKPHEGRRGFRATVAREWSAVGQLFPVFPANSKH